MGGCTKRQWSVYRLAINSFQKLPWNLGSRSLMIVSGSSWWLMTSVRKWLATVCASVLHVMVLALPFCWIDPCTSWWFCTHCLLEALLQSQCGFIPMASLVLPTASTVLPISWYPLWRAGIIRISYNTFVLHWSSVANKITPLSSTKYAVGQNVLGHHGIHKEWSGPDFLVRTISLLKVRNSPSKLCTVL